MGYNGGRGTRGVWGTMGVGVQGGYGVQWGYRKRVGGGTRELGGGTTVIVIANNTLFPMAVVTVSLPTMVSVSEAERRVEVCATLSGVTETPINITLVASDSSASEFIQYHKHI